jgi:hypothetical protein
VSRVKSLFISCVLFLITNVISALSTLSVKSLRCSRSASRMMKEANTRAALRNTSVRRFCWFHFTPGLLSSRPLFHFRGWCCGSVVGHECRLWRTWKPSATRHFQNGVCLMCRYGAKELSCKGVERNVEQSIEPPNGTHTNSRGVGAHCCGNRDWLVLTDFLYHPSTFPIRRYQLQRLRWLAKPEFARYQVREILLKELNPCRTV